MAQTETLALIHEIESLVSDKLQVVSYKWLSRSYMVSSDEAKRLLQEFVQKHEGGLEVVYALSGWLKSSNPSYHIRLVTGPQLEGNSSHLKSLPSKSLQPNTRLRHQAVGARLKTNRTDGGNMKLFPTFYAEAQKEFDGNCSVQIYSVQASIPKDPAVLWNAEFVQAEELFKQPSSVDNCLRDNRFCGISNSSVRRNVDGLPVVSASPQAKSVVGMGPTKSNVVHQPPKYIVHDSIAKVDLKSQNVVKDVKSESNGTAKTVVHDNINKPTADKEKALPLPTGKKKVQADKNGPVTGGSLASLWGRASAKPKPCSLQAENSNTVSKPAEAVEDAQTFAHETGEGDSGDDDKQDVTVRRSSNRKRRVVFDFSDEDEDEEAINLASPDFPNKQSSLDSRQSDKISSEKATLDSESQKENKSRVKDERATEQKAHQPLGEDVSVMSRCTSTGKSSTEKLQHCAPEICVNKDSVKKPLQVHLRGENNFFFSLITYKLTPLTEVVWEGEETEAKKDDKVTTKKADNNPSTNAINREDEQEGNNMNRTAEETKPIQIQCNDINAYVWATIVSADGFEVENKLEDTNPNAPETKKPQAVSNNTTGKGGSKKAGKQKDPKQGNILSFFKRV
ncbi:DNA-polymerase subunit Cdc27 [Sesbania bispinosa]|nr:DNA-polymerase subunit Cdc27 [Sesbania bispinosa]